MDERLMEILVRLLKEIDMSDNGAIRLKDLSETLRLHGFSETELDTALSWLTDRLTTQKIDSHNISPSQGSIRVLHPIERMILSPEAYGYLLHLENVGLIDRDQIEAVIEKALSSGLSEVTINDMKTITATVVVNSEDHNWFSSGAIWANDEDTMKVQ